MIIHPDPEEAARQLYLEHPHILREDKIPVHKIAALIVKIKEELQIGDEEDEYYGEEFEESGEPEEVKPMPMKETPKEPAPVKQVPKFKPKFPVDN